MARTTKQDEPLNSPEGWLEQLRREKPSKPGRMHDYEWQYSAAETLHAWKLHQHHENRPMLLTRKDFEAALAAIFGDERGICTPHDPAKSPHKKG